MRVSAQSREVLPTFVDTTSGSVSCISGANVAAAVPREPRRAGVDCAHTCGLSCHARALTTWFPEDGLLSEVRWIGNRVNRR